MSESNKEINKYWLEIWKKEDIPFHMENVNPLFERHTDWLLEGRSSARIFFPLCGKAVDMKWLYGKGHVIIGVEGVEVALQQFFEESNIPFQVNDKIEGLKQYRNIDGRISLYAGNYFNLPEAVEEGFDAVWDCGAIEAIVPEERPKYVELMKSLTKPGCRLLVEVAERDDNKGPPHHISLEEMKTLFGDDSEINVIDREDPKIDSEDVPEELKAVTGFRLYSIERKS